MVPHPCSQLSPELKSEYCVGVGVGMKREKRRHKYTVMKIKAEKMLTPTKIKKNCSTQELEFDLSVSMAAILGHC